MKKNTTRLFKILLIGMALGSSGYGQSYFNALMINQLSSGHSRDIALAGANTTDFSGPQNTFTNPANQSRFSGLQLSGGFVNMSMNENRSYAAIDQFADRVTDNIYVVSKGSQIAFSGGLSWGTGRLGVSMVSMPLLTPAFFYKEEIRGSQYPPNVNRDPLVGYHHIENSGVIQGTGISAGSSFGSWSVGGGFRLLHGVDLQDQFGVTVLNDVDTSALATGTTFLQNESWSLDNTPLIANLGIMKDLGPHWRLSASYQSAYTLKAMRQGAIPTFDASSAFPLISWEADTITLETEIPGRVEVGLRMKPSNPLPTAVYISLIYQDWSQYSISYQDSLANGNTSFDYPLQETLTISGGVEHWVSEQVPFRAGFSWIESPLSHGLAQSRFSAGSGWVSGPFRFDIGIQISSVQYSFGDIFTAVDLSPHDRENVSETNTNYSFTVSYSL